MTPASVRSNSSALRHAYDAPGLSPYEFLLTVMRDRSAPISTRIDAAAKLLPLPIPPALHEPTALIRLPPLPPPVLLQ